MKRSSSSPPRRLARRARPASLLAAAALASCTVVSVDGHGAPPRLESHGLLEGHAAIGIPAEDRLLHLELLDGRSDGAIGEIILWKLFRLELGLAGASVGIGPFDFGLGILAYEPEVPPFQDLRSEEAAEDPGTAPPPAPAER